MKSGNTGTDGQSDICSLHCRLCSTVVVPLQLMAVEIMFD